MNLRHKALSFVATATLVAGLHSPTLVQAKSGLPTYCDFSMSKVTTNATSTSVKTGTALQVTCTIGLGGTTTDSASCDPPTCNVVLSINGVQSLTQSFNPLLVSPHGSKTFTFSTTVTQPVGSTVTYTCEVNPLLTGNRHAVPELNYTNNSLSTSLTVTQ